MNIPNRRKGVIGFQIWFRIVEENRRCKRRAKIAYADHKPRLRWYVSGRVYRTLPVTPENIELSKRWVGREG